MSMPSKGLASGASGVGGVPSSGARTPHSIPDVAPAVGLAICIRFAIVLGVGGWALWFLRILPRRSGLGHVLPSVASLDSLTTPIGAWAAMVAVVIATALALWRCPSLGRSHTLWLLAVFGFVSGLAVFVSPVGHHVGIFGLAAWLAIVAAAIARRSAPAADRRREGNADRWVVGGLWVSLSVTHMIYSMHRHWAFGSGSWDHGCMVHNFYRASRFLQTTSTVLGDVDFLGDHFMVGIYLYAPLIWLSSSGYTVLAIQSINLACVGPAVYLIARHHRAPIVAALALALATGLSFGIQSAAYFDSHEITVGFGFLAWGLWAFETRRWPLATALLFTFALFKESLGAYVVALGLLAVYRGLRYRDRAASRYGAGWIAAGAVWFVVVNRVFMPALIARANMPEAHETFGDFGPTVFQALLGILSHPFKAFGALFVPGDKLWSHLTTFGGLGWMPLLAPDVGIAALPLFAERFLSSKATMWQMGYHYAAPLSMYAGWAAARGFGRAERWTSWGLEALGGRRLQQGAPVALAVYVMGCTALINEFGYRHAANYHRWRPVYFSTPARRDANAEAVRFLRAQGRDAKLAVQNRILPHLADRPWIYRLHEWRKADWVLLSVGENAWPKSDRYPGRLAGQLHRDRAWRLVFAREGTAVFARASASELPAVTPSAALGLPLNGSGPGPKQGQGRCALMNPQQAVRNLTWAATAPYFFCSSSRAASPECCSA